jgi:NAD+-dependent protein deacetylase sirtuin 4
VTDLTAPHREAARERCTSGRDGFEALRTLLAHRRIVVLSGAGLSTESGIPDYRGPTSVNRTRKPIQHGEFVRDAAARARYWARSTVGWTRIRHAEPNDGHRAIARMEDAGIVRGVITQNVDGLHQAGGSRRVLELHGSLASVCCLACPARFARAAVQARLMEENADWYTRLAANPLIAAPDGDAELGSSDLDGFRVPRCPECDGVLKPDVVFFGDNVPPDRLASAWEMFGEAEVLLVVGSSLTVFSGRRFVHRAADQGIPVAVINLGPTRADEVAAARVEGRLGEVLPRLADTLVG